MNEALKKLLADERKRERDLADLKGLREKTTRHKNPDPKVLVMIDNAIKELEEPK